ncbi:MAG: hypothetical protein M3Y81_16000 [Chloroflexota bacterium]|nr:hypothetical protein [Chloroflexota bacterium]
MAILGILILSSAADNSGMRVLLLALVLLAVLLILIGCTIALLTFLNLRKARMAYPGSQAIEGPAQQA